MCSAPGEHPPRCAWVPLVGLLLPFYAGSPPWHCIPHCAATPVHPSPLPAPLPAHLAAWACLPAWACLCRWLWSGRGSGCARREAWTTAPRARTLPCGRWAGVGGKEGSVPACPRGPLGACAGGGGDGDGGGDSIHGKRASAGGAHHFHRRRTTPPAAAAVSLVKALPSSACVPLSLPACPVGLGQRRVNALPCVTPRPRPPWHACALHHDDERAGTAPPHGGVQGLVAEAPSMVLHPADTVAAEETTARFKVVARVSSSLQSQ